MLANFTIQELQAEIDRKRTVVTGLPIPVANPDFTEVKNKAIKYIEAVSGGLKDDQSFREALFAFSVEAVYPDDNGEAIWEWIRLRRETSVGLANTPTVEVQAVKQRDAK